MDPRNEFYMELAMKVVDRYSLEELIYSSGYDTIDDFIFEMLKDGYFTIPEDLE